MIRGVVAFITTLVLFAAMLTVLTGCAWSWPDRMLAADIVGCEALDVMQTRWALRNRGHELNNYAYGSSNPSTARLITVKVANLTAFGALTNYYPKGRTGTLLVGEAVCLGAVGWNYRQGNSR